MSAIFNILKASTEKLLGGEGWGELIYESLVFLFPAPQTPLVFFYIKPGYFYIKKFLLLTPLNSFFF